MTYRPNHSVTSVYVYLSDTKTKELHIYLLIFTLCVNRHAIFAAEISAVR